MNNKYIAPNAEIELINAIDVITLSDLGESDINENDTHNIGGYFGGFN